MALLILGILTLLSMVLASKMGAVPITWSEWWQVVSHTKAPPEQAIMHSLMWNIRIPRVVLAVLAGAVLATTGAAMQALFRNPLAEPGLIGVSAGASLGAILSIVLISAAFVWVASLAFVGSLISTLLAYLIGRRYGGVAGLLLAGVAINALVGSAIGLLTYMASDTQLRDLTFWSMGSLAIANWQIIGFIVPWSLLLLVILCTQWRALNVLLLGEREVEHLGFSIKTIRRTLVTLVALLVGPLVAVTGGIGFVGLIVPHIMRLTLSANHKFLLPASILGGALLMIWADCIARSIISPAELPIGLVTSLIGGPFFLWLLLNMKQR
ncbi:FecCD family ABC transporter permease [Brackiella oedipodis]|uniref:FecCD family ABC transporter permease n=1 Tax=Brackiella oedipodis TaxID=124225 RepID=UPI003CCC01F0